MSKEGGDPERGPCREPRLSPRNSPRRAPHRAVRRDLSRAKRVGKREEETAAEAPLAKAPSRDDARALLVAIDSEGTVLDSTRPRHELCYAPAFAAIFGDGAPAEAMKEVWRFVALESRLRDADPFRQLAAAIRMAARRPELAPALRGEERVASALEAWLASASGCSAEQLASGLEGRRLDRCLFRALDWSRAADAALGALPPPLAFAGAVEALPHIAAQAEIVVLSGSSASLARREWEDAGLDRYASRFLGCESGDKAARLASMRAERGEARLLVVGDSTSDLEAARRAGAPFFPVEPGDEDASWAEFASAYLPRFAAGEAPRGPLAAFLAALAAPPRWR